MLKKYKLNGEIEFAPVYFNSKTKTVIRHKFNLENAFQEILYLIDNSINEGSGWIVESIKSQYINILTYQPLSGSSYKLTCWIKKSKKRTNQCQKQRSKMFFMVSCRHINPSKEHPERIKKKIKILLSILLIHKKMHKKINSLLVILIMMEMSFLFKKKIFARLKKRTIFVLTCLVMKMGWFFQFTFQVKNLKTPWICCF